MYVYPKYFIKTTRFIIVFRVLGIYISLVILGIQLSIMVNLTATKSKEEFLTCEFEIIFEQWNDPFDSIGLKIVTIIVYAVVIFASLIMLAFVDQETRGFFGHFRTLINQLLSYLYGGVSNLYKYNFVYLYLPLDNKGMMQHQSHLLCQKLILSF